MSQILYHPKFFLKAGHGFSNVHADAAGELNFSSSSQSVAQLDRVLFFGIPEKYSKSSDFHREIHQWIEGWLRAKKFLLYLNGEVDFEVVFYMKKPLSQKPEVTCKVWARIGTWNWAGEGSVETLPNVLDKAVLREAFDVARLGLVLTQRQSSWTPVVLEGEGPASLRSRLG